MNTHVKRFEYWFKKDKSGQKLEIKHGKERRWNDAGTLVYQRGWSNDKWDGWEKEWQKTLLMEQKWRNGKKHGFDRYYRYFGKLWRETYWDNDVQVGEAKVWDENGILVEQPRTAKVFDLGDGIGLELMLIPSGEFMMGSPEDEIDRSRNIVDGFAEETLHKVKISHSFYMGKFEVTQEQYEKIMGTNPSANKGANYPVEKVSWNDAVAFCQKLTVVTGEDIRLPTEAQWEFACRSGNSSTFCFSADDVDIDHYAWHIFNCGYPKSQTHPVGQKIPNKFGLYDMHGNVWEWCQDRYDVNYYQKSPQDDPIGPGPETGGLRVLRGGSWYDTPERCRSASRIGEGFDGGDNTNGFRVVCIMR